MIESATERAPRRRWYQFRLRTLLVGMVVFVVAIGGWVAYRRYEAQRNRERLTAIEEVIAWIEEVGGTNDAIAKTPRSQTWLEQLFNDPGGVDDPAIVIVVSWVYLGHEGTAELGQWNGHSLEPPWRIEYVNNHDPTRITDAGLEQLKSLSNLTQLGLDGTSVTDVGLANLAGLADLQELILSSTQVTGAGLEHLKGLTKLEVLYIEETQVTEAGLKYMKGLTGLKQIWLDATQVTDDGVADLRRALPDCQIYH